MSIRNKIFAILFIVIILLQTIAYAIANDNYIWTQNEEAIFTNTEVADNTGNFLNLQSGSAILIEQNTGRVLYEHNIHEQLRPASVTKVMTVLLIMEALDRGEITLETQIPCSKNASNMGGSQIWLNTTENLTVNEMLKAICVVSANDCTVAMAEYLGGTEEAFVQRMNQRAKELGMNDTTFKNCHGLDEDGHVTSSYDISLMSRELLMKHNDITKYTTIWMDSLRNGESELVNTNKLIRNYEGATGLKTGSTSVALFNLSASATRDGMSLIAVIMKAPTSPVRFAEAQKLLDYGFSNYCYINLAKQGDIVRTIQVQKGVESTMDVVFESEAGMLVKKGQEKQITQTVVLEESILAPIAKGQKLGEVVYSLNNEEIKRINIVSTKEIKKVGLINNSSHIFEKWFSLLR